MKNVKKFNKAIKQTMELNLDKIAITAPRQHGSTHALLQMVAERCGEGNNILVVSRSSMVKHLYKTYCELYNKLDNQVNNVSFISGII